MSDDTPTQRLPETPDAPAEPGATGELADERRKSRALLFTLIGVAAALVITIVVLLIVFLSGGDDAPQAAPTESTSATPTPTATESSTPTPTATPTVAPEPTVAPTQAPPPPSPIVSFRPSTTDANCPDPDASVPITFNWNTTGESVSFGVGTDFADQQPYESGLPGVGGRTVDYQCSEDGPDQKYSIAVFHNGEVIARQTVVIRD